MDNTCIETDTIPINVRSSTEPTYGTPCCTMLLAFCADPPLRDRCDHVFADMRNSMYEISFVFLSFSAGMPHFEALYDLVSVLRLVFGGYPITLILFSDVVGRLRR